MQPGRPWILMTGHRISCPKSKFPLFLLFNQIFSSQCAVLLFAEQFSPTFFLMKFFFFLNYRYSSLRLVPAYNKFIQERFERCLDLYLCPRQRKMRVSLIKKHKGIHLLLGLFCNLFSSLDYATVGDSKNLQRFMEAMLKWRLSVLGIKLQWWVPQSHLPFQSDDLL